MYIRSIILYTQILKILAF